MSGVDRLLLDTNVWLDYYFGDRQGSPVAARLVMLAAKRGVELLYAVGSSKDVYYLSAARLKAMARAENGGELPEQEAIAAEAAAMAILRALTEQATAVGADGSDVWLALKQRPIHKDYEDNLVVAAAMRSSACLVTNDERLRPHCAVGCLDPASACELLAAEADAPHR